MEAKNGANSPITTLTERERQALRGWLEHKTAKEIALDLGVSHHAIEKRLKTARLKLGVASSLEAARMLARAEGYDQTVTAPADLTPAPSPRLIPQYRSVLFGGIAMSLTIAFALALTSAGQPGNEATKPADPGVIQIDTNMEPIFNKLDENGSGYLEQPESPFVAMAVIDPARLEDPETMAVLGDGTDPEQIAQFYAEADTDGDGRISFREFHAWNSARLAELGIDTTIALKVRPVPES